MEIEEESPKKNEKIKKNSHKNIEIKPDHFLIFNIFSLNFRKPNKKNIKGLQILRRNITRQMLSKLKIFRFYLGWFGVVK